MKVYLLRGLKTNKIYRTHSEEMALRGVEEKNFELIDIIKGDNMSFQGESIIKGTLHNKVWENQIKSPTRLIKRQNGDLIDE